MAERSAVERALELLLYAPVGLARAAADDLPDLIERGRAEVTRQLVTARMMGEYAVAEGQKRFDERVRGIVEAISRLQGGDTGAPDAPPIYTDTPGSSRERSSTPSRELFPEVAPGSEVVTGQPDPNGSARPVEDLAIPGYGSLSASQVVTRLDSLTPDQLESVREYELSTRGRRTILSRIATLQAARTGSA